MSEKAGRLSSSHRAHREYLSMVLCLFTYQTGVEVVCEWGSDLFKLQATSRIPLLHPVKWVEFFLDPIELRDKDYLKLLCDTITHTLYS